MTNLLREGTIYESERFFYVIVEVQNKLMAYAIRYGKKTGVATKTLLTKTPHHESEIISSDPTYDKTSKKFLAVETVVTECKDQEAASFELGLVRATSASRRK